MQSEDPRNPEERHSTDESLRTERKKTDRELASGLQGLKDAAHEVVTDARDEADSALSSARDQEDAKLEARGSTPAEIDRVDAKRVREDDAVVAERSDADRAATAELDRQNRALASLLRFEREDTDLRLQIERTLADGAVSSREDFLAMVSHDLRTLLGGVALSAERLKQLARAEKGGTEVARHAETIQRFSARMNRLIGDLMDVASIEAGRLGIAPAPNDPALVVGDAIASFAALAAARNIELTASVDPGLPPVEFDGERILQVLTNLVGNAIKFTKPGGRVTVRAQAQDGEVRFSVADTGEGIARENLEKIFERFFQTRDNDRRGLGLGLYIASSIVSAHGGRIWVESTLGSGSQFFFTLPRRSSLH